MTMSAPYSRQSSGERRVVREPRDRALAVADDARPLAEARQARDPAHQAAHLAVAVNEVDAAHAALAEHARTLHPSGPGADHKHVGRSVPRAGEALRVPAPAVLLAHRRVLCADDRRAEVDAADAGVAADALADLVEPALVDLLRQEGIGDGRARRSDHVERAAANELRHRVGASEAPDAGDRLRGERADLRDPRRLPALGPHPRRRRVVGPLVDGAPADLEVPKVDEVVGVLDEARRLNLSANPFVAVMERVDAHSDRDRAAVADRLPDELNRLAPEAGAILEAATVLVATVVPATHEEVDRDRRDLASVDVDHVEAGRRGAPRGRDIEALQLADLRLRHRVARLSTGIGEVLSDAARR